MLENDTLFAIQGARQREEFDAIASDLVDDYEDGGDGLGKGTTRPI